MGSVLKFPITDVAISDRAFDAETTALICQAFDLTCRDLHDKGQPALVTEIIAKRLIEIAARGERVTILDRDMVTVGPCKSLRCDALDDTSVVISSCADRAGMSANRLPAAPIAGLRRP